MNSNGIVKVVSNLTREQMSHITDEYTKVVINPPYTPLNALGQPFATPRTWLNIYEMAYPERKLHRRGNDIYHRIRKLEPITSALARDGSDPKHFPLHHVFTEDINDSKRELLRIRNELLPCPPQHWDRLLGICKDCSAFGI